MTTTFASKCTIEMSELDELLNKPYYHYLSVKQCIFVGVYDYLILLLQLSYNRIWQKSSRDFAIQVTVIFIFLHGNGFKIKFLSAFSWSEQKYNGFGRTTNEKIFVCILRRSWIIHGWFFLCLVTSSRLQILFHSNTKHKTLRSLWNPWKLQHSNTGDRIHMCRTIRKRHRKVLIPPSQHTRKNFKLHGKLSILSIHSTRMYLGIESSTPMYLSIRYLSTCQSPAITIFSHCHIW